MDYDAIPDLISLISVMRSQININSQSIEVLTTEVVCLKHKLKCLTENKAKGNLYE
jgi:hypothetical protein